MAELRKIRPQGLGHLKKLRRVLVDSKRWYLNTVWGMNIHPTAEFSLSAKFDRTYPKGVVVGEYSYVAFDARILCHDRTRGLYVKTVIGKNCFIGGQSLILPGVEIWRRERCGCGICGHQVRAARIGRRGQSGKDPEVRHRSRAVRALPGCRRDRERHSGKRGRLKRALLVLVVIWVASLVFVINQRSSVSGESGDIPLAPMELPDRPLKIVYFGTSLTANYDWPEALGAQLSGCLGDTVQGTKIAQPGAGSAWAEAQTHRVLGEPLADLVLLEFAINDADILDGAFPSEGLATHRRIIEDIQSASPAPQIVLMTMSPAHGLRGLARPLLPVHYDNYRTLAQEYDLALSDHYSRWLELPAEERSFDDGLHPPEGQPSEVMVMPLAGMIGDALGVDCSEEYWRDAAAPT